MLQPGTQITGTAVTDAGASQYNLRLDTNLFLLERSDLDRCNLAQKDLESCQAGLKEAQNAEVAAASQVQEPSFLDSLGWGGMLAGAVVLAAGAFVGGVVVGSKVTH